MLTTILKSFDAFVNFARTSISFTSSLTGKGFIVIPISIGVACRISIGNKVIYEIVMQKYNNYRKQYENDQ